MAPRSRYGDLDYSTLVKRGVLLGAAMFLTGVSGEALIATGVAAPAWADTALLAAEALGPLVAVLSVVLFGIALPLTE